MAKLISNAEARARLPTRPWGTATGPDKTNAPTRGAKITAWYLPKNYDWQPQIGLELDWTRYITSQNPQWAGAVGTYNLGNNTRIVAYNRPDQIDFSSNILAVNLLFRYPIGVSASLPEGRWYPYVGIGGGVQRTRVTDNYFGGRELVYSPEWQALAGVKVFLFRPLAVFGEWKRTSTTVTISGGLPDYEESHALVANHFTGGVALHF